MATTSGLKFSNPKGAPGLQATKKLTEDNSKLEKGVDKINGSQKPATNDKYNINAAAAGGTALGDKASAVLNSGVNEDNSTYAWEQQSSTYDEDNNAITVSILETEDANGNIINLQETQTLYQDGNRNYNYVNITDPDNPVDVADVDVNYDKTAMVISYFDEGGELYSSLESSVSENEEGHTITNNNYSDADGNIVFREEVKQIGENSLHQKIYDENDELLFQQTTENNLETGDSTYKIYNTQGDEVVTIYKNPDDVRYEKVQEAALEHTKQTLKSLKEFQKYQDQMLQYVKDEVKQINAQWDLKAIQYYTQGFVNVVAGTMNGLNEALTNYTNTKLAYAKAKNGVKPGGDYGVKPGGDYGVKPGGGLG